MGDNTGIQWTDASWPIVNGCRRVSPGCEHCYSERLTATRLVQQPKYAGLAVFGKNGPRYTGESRLWPPHLAWPLRWTRPRKVFVANMGDLFYEKVTDAEILAVFGVMASAPQHQFQVLTKRSARMREWFAWAGRQTLDHMEAAALALLPKEDRRHLRRGTVWPLPNVWLGVSVEDQAYADKRIPDLLATPAAIRYVSYEPALGPVNFLPWIEAIDHCSLCGEEMNPKAEDRCSGCGRGGTLHRTWGHDEAQRWRDGDRDADLARDAAGNGGPQIHWCIVGGESGPGARPFDLAWARSVIEQCEPADVAVFCKQIGANPMEDAGMQNGCVVSVQTTDRKGGDMAEWAEDLRVREFPAVRPCG